MKNELMSGRGSERVMKGDRFRQLFDGIRDACFAIDIETDTILEVNRLIYREKQRKAMGPKLMSE